MNKGVGELVGGNLGSLGAALFLTVLMTFSTSVIIPETVEASGAVYVIDSQVVDIFVEYDGSADVQYTIAITIRPQSDPVDRLRVHLPNWRFDVAAITATIDGDDLKDLKVSKDDDTILQISLNSVEVMQPGTDHTFIFITNVEAMVLKHPKDPDIARVSITPTWWDPEKVQQIQGLEVNIHLPEGYTDEGSIHHSKGATVYEAGGRLVLTWSQANVAPNTKQSFQVDLPSSVFSKVYDPFWDISLHYWIPWLIAAFILIVVSVVALVVKRALRRPYIKPFLKVEAWGAKKGLGPMEAAILLGLDKERLAYMFLVDLIMVGAIDLLDKKAMMFKILNPGYAGRSCGFLKCIREGKIDIIAASNLIDSLKDELDAKMKGFDTDATIAHYKAQSSKRWPKFKRTRSASVDEVLWLMGDPMAPKFFDDRRSKGVPGWTKWKLRI